MTGLFFLGSVVFLVSSVGLCFSCKHVLNMLILLEGMFLGVFCCIISYFGGVDCSPLLVLIIMMVCEAGIGLSVVVSVVRSHGNDYVLGLSSQKC
uniref:NADH-ubiquinone oxidoreductase chain 4L n=1 Tax=Cucullaea labiata TaxID=142556 RepID=A0A141AX65_9BIVA|nr:NADH dehydrogenase subunit 4L [Cucullaea labiata]